MKQKFIIKEVTAVTDVTFNGNSHLAAVSSSTLAKVGVTLPSEEKRPCFRCYYDSFSVSGKRYEAGLYFHESTEDNRSKQSRDQWLSAPLEVVAMASDSGMFWSTPTGQFSKRDFKSYRGLMSICRVQSFYIVIFHIFSRIITHMLTSRLWYF